MTVDDCGMSWSVFGSLREFLCVRPQQMGAMWHPMVVRLAMPGPHQLAGVALDSTEELLGGRSFAAVVML